MPQTDSKEGATDRILNMVHGLSWASLPQEARHTAVRHFTDTVGAIYGGLNQDVTRKVAWTLGYASGQIPDLIDSEPMGASLYLGTTAHATELDDGHRGGSVHPGVAVVPALLVAAAQSVRAGRVYSGLDLLTAMVAGYEVICAVTGAANPALRNQGFHPTSVAGPLGAAMAVGHLHSLSRDSLSNALGIAASTSSGLFAFLKGGGEVKRVHGGLAARGGLTAVLLAEAGISAPNNILERSSGFIEAFCGGHSHGFDDLRLPPSNPFQILDCYIKPFACCRHLQPAMQALIDLRNENGLNENNVSRIEVETYSIAARHATTGWDDMASAQLSFPYCLATALHFGRADPVHFSDAARSNDWTAGVASKIEIVASEEMDARYPADRPARVTVWRGAESFSAYAPEAPGSTRFPLADTAVKDKFLALTGAALEAEHAEALLETLWALETMPDAQILLGMIKT